LKLTIFGVLFRPHPIARLALLAVTVAASGCAHRARQTPPERLDLRFSAHTVIEAAPVHYAIKHMNAARQDIPNGGIASLYGSPNGGPVELAGHADTQALRHSLTHPDLRIILTITEGHYRIVAKRSAGIRSLADLRWKRIATVKDSSAAFYLHRSLATAGMTERDVDVIALPLPPKDSAQLLLDGRADALVLWDPEPEIAIEQLGDDAVILEPDAGYHELYNLHTTAAALMDPTAREKIVSFVARLIAGSNDIRKNPHAATTLAAQVTGYPERLIAKSWPQHRFPATLSPGLIDTLTAEENWLARQENRNARSREELAGLIDPSIEAEARARLPNLCLEANCMMAPAQFHLREGRGSAPRYR
jgi:sulfonate transport system substrate-binding protein